MLGFLDPIRYAARRLRREPTLLFAATGTLAVAIAATATVFSLVNAVLLRPLPYPASERIYWVSEHWGNMPAGLAVSPDYYSIREENRVFESVAMYNPFTLNLTGVEHPEQLDAAGVTPSFFRVMASRPQLGRYLAEGEEGSKAPPVVVLSYGLWRSHFAADPNIAGKSIQLDRQPYTIVGVMPQGFDFPHGTEVWRPILIDEASQRPRMASRPMFLVNMIARTRPGVTEAALATELARLAHNLRAEYPPEFNTRLVGGRFEVNAGSLQRRTAGDLRPALLVMSGAVALVLLIACVNLANLLLARAGGRRRELAVRLALGARRGHVVRLMLLESLLLAVPGGVAGIAVASFAVAVLNRAKPLVLDRYPAIAIDLTTLAFTLAVTLLTAVLFGIAPALSASGVRVLDALKSGGLTQSGGALRIRRFLVVAELAVSLVLLIGAGLLVHSFLKLANVPLGFPPDHLLALRVNLVSQRYATGAGQMDFYNQVLARIRRLPMVRSAAIASDIPLSGDRPYGSMAFLVEGRPPLPMAQRPQADTAIVSPDFFATMGVPVVAGRLFGEQDAPRPASPNAVAEGYDPHRAARAVAINQALAHTVFPGEDPIGRTILGGGDRGDRSIIVAVVGSVRASSLGAEPVPLVYSCACGTGNRFLTRMAIVVRTSGDPKSAITAVQQQVYAVDRNQPVFDIRTMDDRLAASLGPQRFQLILVGAFAFVAIVLAAAGVYGVMSYLVSLRGREIGIRIALGARPQDVRNLLLGESAALSAVAILAGLGGAVALTRYAKSLLYGITALDGVAFAIAPAVLLIAVVGAAVGPTRRAARIDPVTALRQE
ncbi:MAG TPA: ABC transporter permease [Bryobacteraceae bacterium]|nr:ABC transporter permease [Bryobacteraceae bacterium]